MPEKSPAPPGAAPMSEEDALLLRATLESVPAHIAVLDSATNILYVNSSWKIFANENAEPDDRKSCLRGNYLAILRRAALDGVPGMTELAADFEALARGERDVIRFTYPCHSPTEERHFQLMASRLRGHRTAGIAVIHTDITDRVRAERAERERDRAALRIQEESLALLKAFTAALPDLVFAMTPEGIFRDVLSGGDALAVPPENFLGKSVLDVFPGALGQRFQDLIRTAAETGLPQSMSYQLPLLTDGRLHDFEVRALRAGGATVYTIVRDTTELAEATRAREASDARFQQMAEHVHEVFWILELRSGTFSFISRAYEMIWQRSLADGYPTFEEWLETVHPEERERVRAAAAELASGRTLDVEYRILRPDGNIRWVRSRGYGSLDADGPPTRAMGITSDTTRDRLAHERELETMRREASVGRIAAAVAHEVNNPLGTIKFLLRSLSRSAGPASAGDIGVLEEQVNRIATTTRALLGFSRQRNSGEDRLPAAEVIGAVIDLFKGGLEARGIRFQSSLDASLPLIGGDIGAFQEVLINLLENAREILTAGHAVEVTARQDEQGLVVRIRDDGPGLGEDPEKLFRPFVTKRVGGTGLGLAISRRVCESNGGTLTGENALPNGAAFTIRLPARGLATERVVQMSPLHYGE